MVCDRILVEPYSLPPLRYEYSALEPWIDEQTMRIHHDHHHRRYVQALNETEARLTAVRTSGDHLLIQSLQQRAASLASAHYLHRLFWDSMGRYQGRPQGDLAAQINEDFGSLTALKFRFSAAAVGMESGGWVILAWQPATQRLVCVVAEGNVLQADSAMVLLMALDVWEHAYYLKYQQRRAEYVHNWWNTVDWARVGVRFNDAVDDRRSPASLGPSVRDRDGIRTPPAGFAAVAPPGHLMVVR